MEGRRLKLKVSAWRYALMVKGLLCLDLGSI